MLQKLIEQWRASAQFEADEMSNAQRAQTLDQCADELDACRGSLVAALQQIEKEMEIAAEWDYVASLALLNDWRKRLADLCTEVEGPRRAPGAP